MNFRYALGFMTLFICVYSFAQSGKKTVSGKLVERASKQPIEFATIALKSNQSDKVIGGGMSTLGGGFSISTVAKDFYVEISFMGLQTKVIRSINFQNGRANLGTILMDTDQKVLDEIVVNAEKSQTEFKLDKRVFNVGKDLSSSGASALEVLNNVPSVNVNIEGEISLRGSTGVKMLINGKPSVIASEGGNTLGSITAEMIEKVEVITNPSAKYDAEGTSGIINIVLKKNEKKGANGSLSINTGYPHNHSIGLSLNRRTEKFNLFSQMGVGYRSLPRFGENINENTLKKTVIKSDGVEYRNENFYNITLGTDYHINKLNVLTLSGNFAYELEKQPSETDFSLKKSDVVTEKWKRTEETSATNPKWKYELRYKKNFKDHKKHSLQFGALGNFFGKKQSSDFRNVYENLSKDSLQKTRTAFQEAKYTFSVDYTKPFSKKYKLETGAQYVLQDVSNDYAVNNFIKNQWVNNPSLTNLFNYEQNVLAGYATGAYEGDKWGLKLGLRLENTLLNTLLTNTNESNNQNYTNLFPSAHTSYKISKKVSLQAGYSKRIYRPSLWSLNPFFNIRNNYSYWAGNPKLRPQYTDSYELTSIFDLSKISFNIGTYHRYTTDVIERISEFENDISINKPFNIGVERTTGIEFNTKYNIAKKVTLKGDLNFNYFNRKGKYDTINFDFGASQWTTKWGLKFKLPAKIDMEVTANYRSKYKAVQGTISDIFFANIGMKKKMNKGKAILSLSVRDVFASRIFETNIDSPAFSLHSSSRRGRFIVLGFSYGFGKGEAMQYGGGRRY